MRWLTKFHALHPKTGKLEEWIGDIIEADSFDEAVRWCNENGKGYLRVIGEYLGEVKVDETKPYHN